MTRYFFHAADGTHIRDEEGEELAGLAAAKDVALSFMSELLSIKRDTFWDVRQLSISISDDSGRLLAVLTTMATVDLDVHPEAPAPF